MRAIIAFCATAVAALILNTTVPEPAEARTVTYYGRHGHKVGSARYTRSGGSYYGRNGHKVGSFRR